MPVVFQPGRLLCWCFSVDVVRRACIKHAARQVASGSTRAPPISSARFHRYLVPVYIGVMGWGVRVYV